MANTKNLRRLIQEASKPKEVDIPTSFIQDLKYTIIQYQLQNNSKPSETYKPSSFKCIRNMYFQRTGAEIDDPKPNPALVGIAESGTDRHERLQFWISSMKEYGVDCEYINVVDYLTENNLLDEFEILKQGKYETKLQHKQLHVRFLCDGILKYKGEYYILEIKTETSYKWQERKSYDINHKNQTTAYSTLLKINKVLFLYENRDLCDWKSYIFEVTPEMSDELVYKPIQECEEYIKENKVPPIPKVISKKDCQYCGYRKLCKTIV